MSMLAGSDQVRSELCEIFAVSEAKWIESFIGSLLGTARVKAKSVVAGSIRMCYFYIIQIGTKNSRGSKAQVQ